MRAKRSFVIDLPPRRDQTFRDTLGKTIDGWDAKAASQKAERNGAHRGNRDFTPQTHSPASARTGPDDRTASWARPGRGTTSLEYPLTAIATINRDNELTQTFRNIGERRWRLWLEGKPVRIAPDLADTLGQFKAVRSEIKTLSDIETKIPASVWKTTNMPRGHPLRTILRGLSDNDLRSLTTLLICVVLGIRLPLFDELNPSPFQIFKRAFGLPKAWQMPPGLFDVFPYMHEQIKNGLSTATADELEGARAVCRFLSHLLDNPENWRRGAIVVGGAPLPWRPIKLAGLLWPSPVVRAATVGLIILLMRSLKSALGEKTNAALVSIASEISSSWPQFAR